MLASPTGETEHLHNQFLAAIYGNVTREMPDHGVASWVSAHDKPVAAPGTKPVSGDAAEQRLKAEVMSMPNRDRRRLKDLALNDVRPPPPLRLKKTPPLTSPQLDTPPPYPPLLSTIRHPPPPTPPYPPTSTTTTLHKPNWDLEIRKRHAQPLASESGEFPDAATIDARMQPLCFETGLPGGHAPDAAQFMAVAAETFVKRFLSAVFARTRANGPGGAGSAGAGGAAGWVATARYRRARAREEEAAARGALVRDKSGLLPVEARAAGERGALGMADLRRALEVGDCGIGQMPVVLGQIVGGWREGELEGWGGGGDVVMADGGAEDEDEEEESDSDGGWEGAGMMDRDALNGLLDSCLANSA